MGGRQVTVPIELVLTRLAPFKVRENGRDRWRAICPCCGEKNSNTLSIGVGDTGAVLIKCFKLGCDTGQIAQALGLELSDLFPPRPQVSKGSGPIKRRRLITAAQALDLLDSEMMLTIVCASDMASGGQLDQSTRERLLKGAARVAVLRDEVRA